MSKTQTAAEFAVEMELLGKTFADPIDPALEACAEVIHAGIEENFQQSQQSTGQAWPPRKDPKPQHPLLILSGALQAAATGVGAGSVNRIDSGVLLIGVDKLGGGGGIPGAQRHQEGDSPPGILARPYLGMSEETLEECARIGADFVVGELA